MAKKSSGANWSNLGKDGAYLWGECQGSAKTPYKTQIETHKPAYKCTCPSRQFPCKHAVELLTLFETEPEAFITPKPEWTQLWEASHQAKKNTENTDEKTVQPKTNANVKNKTKKDAEKRAKVLNGLSELKLRLKDLIREGIAGLPNNPRYWEDIAKRMTDQQAPGLAFFIRETICEHTHEPNWEERTVVNIAKLYAAIHAYENLDDLPALAQEDVLTFLDIGYKPSAVKELEGINDTWQICCVVEEEIQSKKLRGMRTWLYGKSCGKFALQLQFVFGSGSFPLTFEAGKAFNSEVAWFPSAYPTRAEIKQRENFRTSDFTPIGYNGVNEFYSAYADAIAARPFLELFPAAIANLAVVKTMDTWHLADTDGFCLPLKPNKLNPYPILAVAEKPITIFGEYDGFEFTPYAAWYNDNYLPITSVNK